MGETKSFKTFEEHLESQYGEVGTPKREEFELNAKAFIVGELIKEERRNAEMTQEQLAEKTGTKKSYISRLENGKIDIQLSTLFRIFEKGLGKKLTFSIS
ncbi:MAG: helix-turn-helix transcriptional regulator [bacterium]|nr:helix-turn-helix transcriptional regulator [bacterium]